MQLSDELESTFNTQITLEIEASLVYRQLAIEIERRDLPGMAAWLRHQADEEIVHANKFIDHLLARGNHPVIRDVPAFAGAVDSALDVFQAALEHEQRVSESVRALYRQADSAGDLDSRPLLTWFLSEQLEEEATVTEIVGRISLINNDGPGLLRLDSELGQRPTKTTENAAAAQ